MFVDMPTKIILPEAELPTHWYNIVPDLPSPPPPVLHPGTHQPIGPDDLAPLFPMDLILQEVSTDSYIEIPEEIRARSIERGAHRPYIEPTVSRS